MVSLLKNGSDALLNSINILWVEQHYASGNGSFQCSFSIRTRDNELSDCLAGSSIELGEDYPYHSF